MGPWAGITGIDTLVAEETKAVCGAGAFTGGSGELVVLSPEHTTGESMESETSRLNGTARVLQAKKTQWILPWVYDRLRQNVSWMIVPSGILVEPGRSKR